MRELHFAEFRIDLEQMNLSREEVRIPIGRKTLDVLLLLIENRNRIVSRDVLHRYIWKSERISQSTIPMCISEIRKALGDDARAPRFVASMKGRGYRFLSEIKLRTDAERSTSAHTDFPFVGRKTLLSALQELVRQTRADLQGRTISIVGEPGVGKSRLLKEFLSHSAQNFDYIIARCNSSHQNVAYSIWTNALRIALERYSENVQLRHNAQLIGSILPEIQVDPETASPATKIDRSNFFHYWSNAFRALARQRPLAIALEDFHLADDDSVLLFERLIVELASSPILFITIARPSLATRRFLNPRQSTRTSIHQTYINLAPFTLDEIESLIDPYERSRENLVQEIFRQTAGNAFYVTHLLRMRRTQSPNSPPYPWTKMAAADASEIVSMQLGDLPPATQTALLMASVIGQAFPASIVASALEISTPELLEDLEPARGACVIQSDGSDFAFSHSILRDSLYRSLPPRTRIEHHDRIVRALQRSFQTRPSSASTLFFHLCQAFPLASAEELRAEALNAGADAISRLAFKDALRILDASIAILAREPISDPDAHLEILISRASALYFSGDMERARTSLLEAANWTRAINSPTLLAKCGLAMAPGFLSIELGAYDSDQEMLLREALEKLPADAYGLRAKVFARLSQICRWRWSEPNEPSALAAEAHDLALASGDSDALVAALAARADAAQGPDRGDERIRYLLSLQEATLARSDTHSFMLQQTRLISTLLERGEFKSLRLENDRYRQLADKIGLPQYRWFPLAVESMLACLAGDLDEAERITHHYRDLAGDFPDPNLVQTYACQAVLRGIERGSSAEILTLTESFARENRAVLSWAAAVAWIQWDCGLEDAAKESLRQFTRSDIERLLREPGGTIGLAALAEVCAYLGDRSRSRLLFDLISPVSYTFASAGYGVVYFGSMARYSGLLAIALRDHSSATRLLSLAVEQEQAAGSRSWQVYAILDSLRADKLSLSLSAETLQRERNRLRGLLTPHLQRARRFLADFDTH
ncbi:MAG: AAA family ATPase [Deltaproteobacteria bacterium]|nr:AAA family ATPase [Deltaproteobacteria bacterium]